MTRKRKPSLAVWKMTSCGGCQLALLHCGKTLLELADRVEIADFNELSSRRVRGTYDLSLVEGAVSSPEEVLALVRIRRRSRKLAAVGACAVAGGLQAFRNRTGAGRLMGHIYARPEKIRVLERATPVSAHVPVDLELRGCPVDGGQLLEAIAAVVQRRRPHLPTHALCMECKRLGRVCVMVAGGRPCLGPLVQAGCGALCPASDRGCYGCFGPQETRNLEALRTRWRELGAAEGALDRDLATYNPCPGDKEAGEYHETD